MMIKRLKVSELPEFDAALLAAATGDIARARGMSQVAQDWGVSAEVLRPASSASAMAQTPKP